jgi:hypothetical protein
MSIRLDNKLNVPTLQPYSAVLGIIELFSFFKNIVAYLQHQNQERINSTSSLLGKSLTIGKFHFPSTGEIPQTAVVKSVLSKSQKYQETHEHLTCTFSAN